MRIVFCGTPQFAIPALRLLLTQPDFEIAAVITQPDRPSGRGQEVSFSAVKQAALAANLPVHQPEKIGAPEAQQLLQDLAPAAIVIIAYGQIIPARLLTIPKLGWINLHASLLPKYRGAAPINWAIAKGETKTGVTTMLISAGVDSGDLLLQRETHIGPRETAPDLALRLSELGAPLMAQTLRGLASGTIVPRPQNHSQATLASLLRKEDGLIDWRFTAQEIYNRMRGFAPWPGAYTTFRGHNCHLFAEPVANEGSSSQLLGAAGAAPGTIFADKNGLLVSCGGKTIMRVQTVKLEGRKDVSALEFAHASQVKSGERFGNA